VAGEEPAGKPIDHGFVRDGFFDGDLPRQGGEITVTDFDLHGAGCQSALLHPGGDFIGLLAETIPQGWSMRGVSEEGIFTADALHIISELEGAVVLSKGHFFQLGSP
jgi:hypothetical protein